MPRSRCPPDDLGGILYVPSVRPRRSLRRGRRRLEVSLTTTWLLVAFGPFLALVVLAGAVMTIALVRAEPEDIPDLVSQFSAVFHRLTFRILGPASLPTPSREDLGTCSPVVASRPSPEEVAD